MTIQAKQFDIGLDIQTPFEVLRVIDDVNGLVVLVQDAGCTNQYEFRFDGVYGYRAFDESHVFGYLKRHGMSKSGWYVSDESDLLSWCDQESVYKEVPIDVKHFSIVGANDVVEVLSYEHPTVVRA